MLLDFYRRIICMNFTPLCRNILQWFYYSESHSFNVSVVFVFCKLIIMQFQLTFNRNAFISLIVYNVNLTLVYKIELKEQFIWIWVFLHFHYFSLRAHAVFFAKKFRECIFSRSYIRVYHRHYGHCSSSRQHLQGDSFYRGSEWKLSLYFLFLARTLLVCVSGPFHRGFAWTILGLFSLLKRCPIKFL